jgi:putative ABC transport system permease protein
MTPATVATEVWRSLRAHTLRFALTALGIVWGVAMLTFLLAATDGYEANFETQLDEIGPRAVFLFPGLVTRQGVGQRGSRPVELEREDLERLEGLEGIERAAPHVPLGPRLMRAAGRSKLVWTYGVSADTPAIRNYRIESGRPLRREDVESDARVVVLGATVARRIFGEAGAVGRAVHIDGLPFTVIGVTARKDDQVIYIGPADDEVAMVPFTTAERRFLRDDVLTQVVLLPRSRDTSWAATQDARALLGFHHGFRTGDRGAMGDFNVEEIRQLVAPLYLGLRLFLTAASAVTLLVGAVGVMNIMLVVVTERTREIGLRKAIGASPRAIFVHFLAETLTVCVAAGLAGAGVGWAAVAAFARVVGTGSLMNAPPLLLPGRVAMVLATLLGVGIAAGLLPALRASRVDPAVSLRGA